MDDIAVSCNTYNTKRLAIKDLLVEPEPHQLVSLKKRPKIGKEKRRALEVLPISSQGSPAGSMEGSAAVCLAGLPAAFWRGVFGKKIPKYLPPSFAFKSPLMLAIPYPVM